MTASDDETVSVFLTLLSRDGVQQVANWRLPNDDHRFNETASAERFEANASSYASFLIGAINELEPGQAGK